VSHQALGEQFHPHVQQYRSGGIGHLDGDDSNSVVGFVPTHSLLPYREHNGMQGDPGHDRKVIDGIRSDLRAGKGFSEPVQLFHDDRAHWGSLGEGNHRLQAAVEEGISHVPLRVHSRVRDVRSDAERRRGPGGTGGAPLKMATNFDRGDYPYTPPDVHPLHFEQFKDTQ